MRRHAWLLPAVGALALGLSVLAVARGRDKDEDDKLKAAAAAAPDVNKLADAAADPAALKKAAAAISAKDELLPIMWAFKPQAKGGIIPGKGIELGLISLGKKPLPAKDLTAQSAELKRTGRSDARHRRGDAELRRQVHQDAGRGEGMDEVRRGHAEIFGGADRGRQGQQRQGHQGRRQPRQRELQRLPHEVPR